MPRGAAPNGLAALRSPLSEQGEPAASRRRPWRIFGRVAAGVVVVIALIAGAEFLIAKPDAQAFATAVGGHKILKLADGSQIELNTDTQLRTSALSQEQLTATQTAGAPDRVKQAPNLTFSKTNFSGYNIQIRGIDTQAISVTTDPAVAVAFNGDVFYNKYQNYRIPQIADRTSINLNFNADVKGIEVESTWEPVPGLRFNFAGGYESTRLAGDRSDGSHSGTRRLACDQAVLHRDVKLHPPHLCRQ